jgi:Uma2 family endonuclease
MTVAINPNFPTKKSTSRLISLETFHRLYDEREDDYRYEWHNGSVEKTPRTMNRSQSEIVQILSRFFATTEAYREMGELEKEVKMFLPKANRTRIADLAFLTAEQVKEKNDVTPSICEFVIEVISKTDRADDIDFKIDEYFADGVKIVWQIFPKLKKVEVYTSPESVTICRGDTVCSASPVLKDFNIKAEAIFR